VSKGVRRSRRDSVRMAVVILMDLLGMVLTTTAAAAAGTSSRR
jgi:hypothetical protein